jgi:hypothetical protein
MAKAMGLKMGTYAAKEAKGDFSPDQFAVILKKLGVSDAEFDAFRIPGEGDIEIPIPAAIINIQAMLDVALMVLAELLAKQNGQSVTGASNDLTRAVQERSEQRLKELNRT